MGYLIYFLVIVCMVLGVIGLVFSFVAEESDGSKRTAQAIRSVGFLLLAGLLRGFAG